MELTKTMPSGFKKIIDNKNEIVKKLRVELKDFLLKNPRIKSKGKIKDNYKSTIKALKTNDYNEIIQSMLLIGTVSPDDAKFLTKEIRKHKSILEYKKHNKII